MIIRLNSLKNTLHNAPFSFTFSFSFFLLRVCCLFFLLMFHCKTREKGKTQLGIDLLYPSVYAYATLFHLFKSGKVNRWGIG